MALRVTDEARTGAACIATHQNGTCRRQLFGRDRRIQHPESARLVKLQQMETGHCNNRTVWLPLKRRCCNVAMCAERRTKGRFSTTSFWGVSMRFQRKKVAS